MNDLMTARELGAILDGAEYAAFDFETDGIHPKKAKPLGLSVATNKGQGYVPLDHYITLDSWKPHAYENHAEVGDVLREFFVGENALPALAWNLKFDAHYLYQLIGDYPTHPVDAEIGYWLLHEEGKHGLKEAVGALTGQDLPDYGDWKKKAQARLNDFIHLQRENYATLQKLGGRLKRDARVEAKNIFPNQDIIP